MGITFPVRGELVEPRTRWERSRPCHSGCTFCVAPIDRITRAIQII